LPERDVSAAQQVADRFEVASVVGVARGDVPYGEECQGHGITVLPGASVEILAWPADGRGLWGFR
jgi:hypothetical protein